MFDVDPIGSNLAHRPRSHSSNGLDEVILAPDLDHGVIDEDVDQLALVGVGHREQLVVDGQDGVGRDSAKDPLAPAIVSGVPDPLDLVGSIRDGVDLLRIGPIAPGPLGRLLRRRLDDDFPPPIVRRIHEASGWDPFFALEIGRDDLREALVAFERAGKELNLLG
jgi:hypothetical protein